MRTPPPHVALGELTDAVERHWGLRVGSVEHRPLGFGSYHWQAAVGDQRWWVTVDDLDMHRSSGAEPFELVFHVRLRNSQQAPEMLERISQVPGVKRAEWSQISH